nr:MAG: ORF1 [TTV-like mini virus]
MPPYWNYRYKRWRQRRNWFRRRRFRKNFYRRHRRRYRVREQRRPLPLIQWQPPFIRKCYIKGKDCLIYFNPERLSHNSTMYEQSITPANWPGGGGFAVSQYTLDALYSLHQKCLNWWTGSNVDLPLCRYKGCKLKFYQCDNTDYIVKIQTELPSNSNKLTYPSCQPSMMMMSKKTLIIPSKKNKKIRKAYKSIFIKPPPQLENKWYFQIDMYKTALLTIHTAAISLDNYFQKPYNNSNTIQFPVLNTNLIQNRNMGIDTIVSWPYKVIGTVSYYFYYYDGAQIPNNIQDTPIKDLIPLANPRKYTSGKSFNHHNTGIPTDIKDYFENYHLYWGNPFFKDHLLPENSHNWYYSTVSPETVRNSALVSADKGQTLKWSQVTGPHSNVLTPLEEPIFFPIQYNPLRDTGEDTLCYILQNKSGHGWDPPTNDKLILSGFPMWLIIFGFTDFQTKLKLYTNIDENCILVIKTKYTQRPQAFPIVPISQDFIDGKSPYNTEVIPQDFNKWYPQIQYQERSINIIASSGPGTPFLPDTVSENIQMFYSFKWLWGGSPPKTVNIDNPSHQISYPIPNNEHETTSLQNPGTAPESLLYSFDLRHGLFTPSAISRISKDFTTETALTSITDETIKRKLQTTLQELQTTQEKEQEEKTKVLQLINQLQHQQQCLREQLVQLLTNPQ